MRPATTSRAMPLASRSRPSIPASRAWLTRKSGWSLSSRCGRPARDGPPRVGSLPRLSSAWPADVPCVCGMVAGREMGEVAAEEGAAEATAAGAGAAAGARVNHRPIRWEDAGRDRPAPEQGIYTGPGWQQPMRHPPEASPAVGHSHWAALRLGGACLSLGRRSGLRRRPTACPPSPTPLASNGPGI